MKQCVLCGRNGSEDPLDRHHVFGGSYRKKSEKYGAVVYLCHSRCHIFGPESVHANAKRSLYLKHLMQQAIMHEQNWTTKDFIREFGKNYSAIYLEEENNNAE